MTRFLLDQSPAGIARSLPEMSVPVGQLLTPLTGNRDAGLLYGIDNGAFSGFKETKFLALLERQKQSRIRCLFVCVPDIPFDQAKTIEQFKRWKPRLNEWPLALALQNGAENSEIPWGCLKAVFVGGDDRFKTSATAADLLAEARSRGLHTHVGRVNGPWRYAWCVENQVDSCDGSGVCKTTRQRKALTRVLASPKLFGGCP